MSEFFWTTIQKARKEHFCDYCCNNILPGETYHREIWVPRKGSFHVMRKHEYPSICPPNLADEMYAEMMAQERSTVGIRMIVVEEVVEVLKIALNGKTVIEKEIRRIPKLLLEEPEQEAPRKDFDPDDEIEFPF